MFTKQAGGAVNHPAWVIGHVVYSCQSLGGEMGIEAWLPSEWTDRFGTGSVSIEGRGQYPNKRSLLDALADAQRRVTDRLMSIGERGLCDPLPDKRYRAMYPTIGHAVLHILTVHAGIHIRQITVWRRCMGLGPLREALV